MLVAHWQNATPRSALLEVCGVDLLGEAMPPRAQERGGKSSTRKIWAVVVVTH